MPESRDEILASLGYHDYENYRSRALWTRIKNRVLERDDSTCRRCRGKADRVHHRSYSREALEGRDDSQLASICEGCHHIVEFDDNGAWRSPEEEDAILLGGAPITPYPEVKVDMRHKLPKLPDEWDRMDWWQRKGWKAEYNVTWYSRKFSKSPTVSAETLQTLLGHFRKVLEAVANRTPESTWRIVPVLEPTRSPSKRRWKGRDSVRK